MLDRIYNWIVTLLYGKHLRKVAEEIAREEKDEVGRYIAARYTRGNIAIQQGRIDTRKLN